MIKLNVINDKHFIFQSNEPCRIEVSNYNNTLIAHFYKGMKINHKQEPLGAFDSSIENKSITIK